MLIRTMRSWLSRLSVRTPIRKRPHRRLTLEMLEDRVVPDAVTWNVTTSGNWDTAANWLDTTTNQARVPTSGDAVTINQPNITVTVQAGDTEAVQSLTTNSAVSLAITGGSLTLVGGTLNGPFNLSGGTLTFNGAVTTANTSTWSAGTLNGSGTITNSGTLDVAAGSSTFTLGNNLNNTGTLDVQSGTLNVTGAISQITGTTLNGGTWEVDFSATLNLSSEPDLSSAGAGSSVTLEAGASFPQFNTVTSFSGLLALVGGGGASGTEVIDPELTSISGNLSISNETLVAGGTTGVSITHTGSLTLGPGGALITPLDSTIASSGTIEFAGGEGGPFDSEGTTIIATAGLNLEEGVIAGTLEVSPGASLEVSGTAVLGGVTASGGGTVLINENITTTFGPLQFPAGMLSWVGGTLDTTTGSMTNTGFMTINTNPPNGSFLGTPGLVNDPTGGGFVNSGTLTIEGTNFFSVVSTLTNQAGGTVDMAASGGIQGFEGTGTFTNAGTVLEAPTSLLTSTIATTFNQTGGTINVQNGVLQFTGTSTISGGSITIATGALLDNTGTMSISAATAFSAPTSATFDNSGTLTFQPNFTLGGGTLNNTGTVTTTGAGTFVFDTGAVLNNLPGGTYELQGAISFSGSSGINNRGTVNNQGTFLVAAGAGTSSIPIAFNNQGGTIEVNSGTLDLTGPGAWTGGTLNADGVLDVAGTLTLTGDYTGLGTGTVELNATITIGAQASDTATFDFPTVLLQWQSGSISGPGTLTNQAGAFINVNDFNVELGNGNASVLDNAGTINDGAGAGSAFFLNTNAVFDNLSRGIFDFQGNSSIAGDDGFTNRGTINNQGTILKSIGTGTSSIPIALNNQGGTIEADSGTLDLTGTGAWTGGTLNANAVLDVAGASTLTGTYTGSGTGNVELNATITIGAQASDTATFDFPINLLQWQSGKISGPGTLTNQAGAFITVTGSNIELGNGNASVLDNAGTINDVAGAGSSFFLNTNAVFNNLSGGVFNFQGNASFSGDDGFNNRGAINNQGTMLKSAGAGVSSIPIAFSNTGAVEVESGTLAITGSLTQISANALTAGAWDVLDGSTLDFPGGANITTNQANVTLQGSGSSFPALADLASNAGSFTLGNISFTTVGNYANSGSTTLDASGTLTVHGNFTQTSAGTLTSQLGGTPASGLFGQLHVQGSASLAGTFALALATGFTPAANQDFPVATFTSATGAFATLSGLSPFYTSESNPGSFDVVSLVSAQLTSSVAALPAISPPQFTISWSGADTGGPGIASFTIFVSDNGGPFTALLTNTTSTSTSFTGTNGHTYGFFSIATDVDGDVQPPAASAQASTTVSTPGVVVFTSAAQTLTAGQPSGLITVTLEDAENNVTQAGNGGVTINLSSSSASGAFLDSNGNPLAGNAVSIPQGASTATFEYEDTLAGAPTLTASSSGLTAGTQQETVNASDPAKVIIISAAQSLAVGAPSGPITVELEDANDNEAQAGAGGVTINLTSSSAGGSFLDSNGNALAGNAITIAQGASTATFEYEDTQTGTPTLTAAATGLTADTQQESVQTAVPSTAISASPIGPTTYGVPVTLTATVTSPAGAGSPTGAVEFFDGATDLGAGTLQSQSGAVTTFTLTTSLLNAGNHSFQADFTGTGVFGSSNSSLLAFTVNPAPLTVTANNQTIVLGAALPTLTATIAGFVNGDTANGSPALSTNFTANSPAGVYTIAAAAGTLSEPNYNVQFVNGTLTVNGPPIVTTNPASPATPIAVGGSATFTAAATPGFPVQTSVLWQINTGSGFTPLSDGTLLGATIHGSASDQLTITNATAALNNAKFEAIFSNAANLTATTSSASLGVNVPPSIAPNGQPASITVDAGAIATFTATAIDGNPTPTTVQWQTSTDNGQTFSAIAGATSTTLSFTAQSAQTNELFEAVFSNAAGLSITSSPAKLTVVTPITPKVTITTTTVKTTFGTALANSQLASIGTASAVVNGHTVNVPGVFSYTSGVGAFLSAGSYSEPVIFTPNDTTTFQTVSTGLSVTLVVGKATPQVTVNGPLAITFGAALSSTLLTPNVISSGTLGSFTFTAAGTVLKAGTQQMESVTFTPADTNDFASVTNLKVAVNVATATPSVMVNPVNITFGTALNNKGQLTGAASFVVNGRMVSVAGAFTYPSAVGTVLNAGNGQTELVTFTPTDTTDYVAVSNLPATVNVAQATPNVTVNPVSFAVGTPLANDQLSGAATFTVNGASVPVAGTFTYASGVGVVLTPGTSTQAVTFTPTDATDYAPVTTSVTATVAKAKPQLTVNPINLTFGAVLANDQLSGAATATVNGQTVNVEGSFTFTAAEVGTMLSVGTHTETVTFTPADSFDYQAVSTTVTVNVVKATPVFSNFTLQHFVLSSGTGDIVTGKLSAGSAAATGALTVNIAPLNATLSPNGTFSINLNTTHLHGFIVVTIGFAGNSNFNAASLSFLIDVL